MGRKEKVINEVISEQISLNRREIGYYSTPSFISEYISKRMRDINTGKSVFDPCCGREELLKPFKKLSIDTFGVDIFKYKENYDCTFKHMDFIEYYYKNINGCNYDYYILNPPYNCHEVDYIKNNKAKLKKKFKDVGLNNMYEIFISAIIDLAKEGAVMGIITHDSFLTAKSYENLRLKILNTCSIHEITMCSVDLFKSQGADVRTSILILQKGLKFQGDIILNSRAKDKEELLEIINSNSSERYDLNELVLAYEVDNSEFIIECPKDVMALFKHIRLGRRFKCITGISTGNDKLYLSKEKTEKYSIPFYKNPSSDRFYTEKFMYIDKDFLEISKGISNFIVRNKEYLYKQGVICSSMGVAFSACKFEEGSTFGVNTCIICDDEDCTFLLLAYLNSNLVTYIVRGILNRSNMITSGYISRIPFIRLDLHSKRELMRLGEEAYNKAKNGESFEDTLDKINDVVNSCANLSKKTIDYIEDFKVNLIKRT